MYTLPPRPYPVQFSPITITDGRHAKVMLEKQLSIMRPVIVAALYATWASLEEPLSDADIRNALLLGIIAELWTTHWRQAYLLFVSEHLSPQWTVNLMAGQELVRAGLQESRAGSRDVAWASTGVMMSDWIRQRAASWAVTVADDQRKALQTVLRYYVMHRTVDQAEMAVMVHLIIGLTEQQALAVLSRRQQLDEQVAGGHLTPLQADKLLLRYSSDMHRLRAENIANTEIALAYNQGQYLADQTLIDQNILQGRFALIWQTAHDERVCDVCGPLDGLQIDFGRGFPTGRPQSPYVSIPPAHMRCRCTVSTVVLPPEDNIVS